MKALSTQQEPGRRRATASGGRDEKEPCGNYIPTESFHWWTALLRQEGALRGLPPSSLLQLIGERAGSRMCTGRVSVPSSRTLKRGKRRQRAARAHKAMSDAAAHPGYCGGAGRAPAPRCASRPRGRRKEPTKFLRPPVSVMQPASRGGARTANDAWQAVAAGPWSLCRVA